jgi:hypothetical protein
MHHTSSALTALLILTAPSMVRCTEPVSPPPKRENQELTTPQVTPRLFNLQTEAWLKIPEPQKLLIEQAQKDLELVASGKDPSTLKRKFVTFDGGTTTFECEGYEITLWMELVTLNKLLFQKRGISISFHAHYSSEYSQRDIVANTWLEPLFLHKAP